MNRGEVWLADVGQKRRPVLVLTRNEVIDVRALVTVAEITTSRRGLAVEVPIDHHQIGLDHESVINCDGIHTIPQTMLTQHVGTAEEPTLDQVCSTIGYALGC